MHAPCRVCLRALVWLLLALAAATAPAATLDRTRLAQYFPPPLIVGERDPELPVWPLLRQMRSARGWDEPTLVGYAFESIDLAPVPGFSGTPMNLLVALGPQGEFLAVHLLSQREPVFVEGLGPEPLQRFVEQYPGLALTQNIKVGSPGAGKSRRAGDAHVTIDGVSKATASVRIVNQSLLAAALKVARAKLGFAAGRDPDAVGRIRGELFRRLDFAGLEREGLVARRLLRNREVEAAFRGSAGESQDETARREPDAVFTELLAVHLSVPTVGRNLLAARAWEHLASWIEPGDHAFLVATRGRFGFAGDDYITGAVPERLTLSQAGLPIEMRDFALDGRVLLPADWQGADVQWRVFKVISQASLDPARPLDLALVVTREKGTILPERVRRSFTLTLQLPPAYVLAARPDTRTWQGLWAERAADIAVLAVALAMLAAVLARPRWLVAEPRRLVAVRTGFMVFTLGFIGWHAQGQLSIVNLTAALQALLEGRSLAFFLYDPMTTLLWAFVLLTLLAWGRGTFCGWLCPFGALQELLARAARALRLPQLRVPRRVDRRLKRLKYAVLALLLAAPLAGAGLTDALVELEPFKTTITLAFRREWPYLAWGVALLAINLVVYKAYCRYLCPLGAGLALAGRLQRLDWLPRRAECGRPCQTCRHRCEYQAIRPDGGIDDEECFQCLDCVAIHASDTLCAPRILQRQGRTIMLRPAPAEAD